VARSDLERRVGDDWSWDWSTDDDVSSWSSPVITIRDGRGTDATVLATTTGASPTITTTGTDFAAGTFAWQVARSVTATLDAGDAWIEVEVLIGGAATTVMSEPLMILPQTAVRP
jgi:hypothetical protein